MSEGANGVMELKLKSMKVKDWSVFDGKEGMDVGILADDDAEWSAGRTECIGGGGGLIFAAPIA